MIQITDEQIDKYQALCIKKFGLRINRQQALNELTALVCLMAAVHRHMEEHNWPDLEHT